MINDFQENAEIAVILKSSGSFHMLTIYSPKALLSTIKEN